MSAVEEGRIVEAVLDGDRDAFGVLVCRYQRPIYNLMYRLSGSAEDAADLTQDTFLKAYNKLESFRVGRRFFPWLYSIGLNQARDWARRRKPTDLMTEEEMDREQALDNPGDCQDRLNEKLDSMRLFEAVSRLPLEYREALVLKYQQDLEIIEVAEIMGISVSGAKMRVHRGLKKLRIIIQDMENG